MIKELHNVMLFRHCNTKTPEENSQWIYNQISWQIVPRKNQSQCLQKLFDTYNVGNPIVLKQCHRHGAQVKLPTSY